MSRSLVLCATLLLVAGSPALAGWDEGVAAFTSKNFEQAAHEFQELVTQNPEGWRGHYMLGLVLEQLSRKEEALHHLRKAYDLNPNEVSVQLALGRAYTNVRRYGDAASLLAKVDDSSLSAAQKAALFQLRGIALDKTGNDANAVDEYKELARLRTDDPMVQLKYGALALKANRIDEAVAALDRAYRLKSSDADIARTYINALLKQGRMTKDKSAKKQRYFKAAEVAQKLAGASATYENLVLQLSAELGAGLYDKAIETGKRTIAKKPDDWIAQFYLGQAYTSAKQYTEAEAPLRTALQKTSDPSEMKSTWTQLGFSYEKQKKYAEAIEAYTNAGDQGAVARVKRNEETAMFNEQVEEENDRIREMEEEARRLEEELKKLEEGGG